MKCESDPDRDFCKKDQAHETPADSIRLSTTITANAHLPRNRFHFQILPSMRAN